LIDKGVVNITPFLLYKLKLLRRDETMLKECRICKNKFDYCGPCAIVKNPFKNAGYCGEDCYHISMILQRYGSNVATATETIKALEPYNINKMSLQPKIEAYYQNIVNEIKPKRKVKIIEEIIPQVDVEVVVENDKDMTISENE
jgi:hypothetical protein